MTDFESFTRERIARLRAEADALEKTLKEFLGAKARASGGSRRAGEGSAFGAVLAAIDAAGPKGLTLDEMIAAAEAEGYEVKRNTLRSQLWSAKQEERVFALEAGRYVSGRPALDLASKSEADDGIATGGFESPMRQAKAQQDRVPENATGGFQRAPARERPRTEPTGPRESFAADLDDEIPF